MRVVDSLTDRIAGPEPNDVPGQFVRNCVPLATEGDGMLYAALWQNKLLYAKASGVWYVWGGHVWRRDRTGVALGMVRAVADRYLAECQALEEETRERQGKTHDNDERDRIGRMATRMIKALTEKASGLRKITGRNGCLDFAASFQDNPLAIEGTEFDHNSWLLGVQNGVVDLRTGTLTAGSPEQMVSRQCSCAYNPDVDQSDWLHFLSTIYNDDQELIDFVQIMFGYGITGFTTEHIFPFLLGRGRNGKSLLINTIARVAGDYAATVPCEIFLKDGQQRAANAANPAIMKHEGLRLAFSSEVEEGARFSAQAVKRMTGGDKLDGRDLYGTEWREFLPTHLSIMVGNHEPQPPAGDPAFWDRTFLIYHPVRFVKGTPNPEKLERQADPDIEEKLKQKDEQVLAWLIEGAVRWNQGGRKIRPPESVRKSTEEYREDSDWITRWIDACCVRDPQRETSSTTLYTAFALWYQENINSKKSVTPSQRAFGLKLKASGEFQQVRRSGGYVYVGVALDAVWERRLMDEATGQEGY